MPATGSFMQATAGVARVVDQPGDSCLLYTSDAADDLLCVDLGGRRIIKKKPTVTVILTSPSSSLIIVRNASSGDYTNHQ